MRSVFQVVTVAYVVAICPVLFTACGGRQAPPVAERSGGSDLGTGSAPEGSASGAVAGESTTVRHVDAKGAQRLLGESRDIVVVDVRTPEEFAAGHVAGAKNIDFNAAGFREELGKLDRGTTYLVHCAAGGRSTRSLAKFKELGFKSVVHLDGGFNGWTEAGLPVEK